MAFEANDGATIQNMVLPQHHLSGRRRAVTRDVTNFTSN
jgi:hypothetical protein